MKTVAETVPRRETGAVFKTAVQLLWKRFRCSFALSSIDNPTQKRLILKFQRDIKKETLLSRALRVVVLQKLRVHVGGQLERVGKPEKFYEVSVLFYIRGFC